MIIQIPVNDGLDTVEIPVLSDVTLSLRKATPPEFLCCSIRRPFSRFAGKSLVSSLVINNLDRSYLTSGALSKSIAVLHTLPRVEKLVEGISLSVDSKPCRLRILGPKHIVENIPYITEIQQLFLEAHPTLFVSDDLKTDFWWDLANHTMLSFDRNFLQRIPEHLAVSYGKL